MKAIPLTQGKVALVDDFDYIWLSQHKWCTVSIRNTYYAITRIGKKMFLMHHLILSAQKGQLIDHKNGNGLDNRRENIRFCTNSQNHQNARKGVDRSSRFKGVSESYSVVKPWRVHIGYNHKKILLGRYTNEIKAAKVYDQKAKELFGEFAHTNFG